MWKLVSAIVMLLVSAVATADDAVKSRPVKEPELRDELLRRVKTDQDARNAMIAWMKMHLKPAHAENGIVDSSKLEGERKTEHEKLLTAMDQVDQVNTQRLREIVEKYGWPTHSLVGNDGASAAWLLVQHADRDPKFQRLCVDLMAKLSQDEVSTKNVAYLTDRVLLAEGKKQRYGTQFMAVDGKWQPRPLEDEANVDTRRATVGLEPLAEYAKALEAQYGPAK